MKDKINYINWMLEGLYLAVNLSEEGMPTYECHFKILKFSKKLSLEDNFKDYILGVSASIPPQYKRKITNPNDAWVKKDWEFKLSEHSSIEDTFYNFFSGRNSSHISARYQKYLANHLKSLTEEIMGTITLAKEGYVCPPSVHDIYGQHWWHLYLESDEHFALYTFEANS